MEKDSANGAKTGSLGFDEKKSSSAAKRPLPDDGPLDTVADSAGDGDGDGDGGGGGNDALDEFDDLTIEELRSLLDNFKNLSKTEQLDLIQYMKKLETTNPEKVKMLRQKK